jgi:hypothetical protein
VRRIAIRRCGKGRIIVGPYFRRGVNLNPCAPVRLRFATLLLVRSRRVAGGFASHPASGCAAFWLFAAWRSGLGTFSLVNSASPFEALLCGDWRAGSRWFRLRCDKTVEKHSGA